MPKILIVDDEQQILSILQRFLKMNGYESITPSSDTEIDRLQTID